MHLTELHIHGFKSFAKGSDLFFNTPVTAIVGPNGSGKSNVAEALRFVLGEQSVKSLRGKKGEDLIWGGSDSLARANRASIKIQLQNNDRALPLDTDVITIERIVHRDGQNEYKINDQTVRLKDVHELLAAGNIGPSGHHIISQGEADRVLSATPQERRAMIEESLGLKVYQYKKQDAEKKLEKTEQNIYEVEGLRREIAPHLKYLKKELDKLEESREIKKILVDKYAEYLRREDTALAYNYDSIVVKEKKLDDKLKIAHMHAVECEASLPEGQSFENRFNDTEQQKRLKEARNLRLQAEQKAGQTIGKINALKDQLNIATTRSEVIRLPLDEVQNVWNDTSQPLVQLTADTPGEVFYETVTSTLNNFSNWLHNQKTLENTEETDNLKKNISDLERESESNLEEINKAREIEVIAQEDLESVQQKSKDDMLAREQARRELYEVKSTIADLQSQKQQCSHELSFVERERESFKDELKEAVALLGRDAAKYFEYEVINEKNQVVSYDEMYQEPREKQRERRRELEKLKIRLETLGDGQSDTLEREYIQTKERDDFLAQELDDLRSSVNTLLSLIDDLSKQIDDQFKVGFQRIQSEFNNFFTLMFGGGKASLELISIPGKKNDGYVNDVETQENKVSAEYKNSNGVELFLQLPNKRVQGLSMLSGGERALTSIALIFAMSQIHPPLFIVLDETDAALDEANSRRYGDLIEALSKRSQLILITHNRETMSRAGTLYGVTMNSSGTSQLLSVQLEDAVVNAK